MAKIESKSREVLVLASLCTAGACVLLGFLFLQIKSTNERTSGLLNEIESQAKEEDTLKALKTLVKEIAPLQEKLNTYFVPPGGTAEFIEQLETVGDTIGVSVIITSVEKGDIGKTAEFETLEIVLHAIGSWEGVVRFLGALEFLPYQTTITQAGFSRSTNEWRIDAALSVLKEK